MREAGRGGCLLYLRYMLDFLYQAIHGKWGMYIPVNTWEVGHATASGGHALYAAVLV
jgi:hypothetical protein